MNDSYKEHMLSEYRAKYSDNSKTVATLLLDFALEICIDDLDEQEKNDVDSLEFFDVLSLITATRKMSIHSFILDVIELYWQDLDVVL